MIVVADTNVVVRAVFTKDTPEQSMEVFALLKKADAFIVTTVSFCEAVWVFEYVYKLEQEYVLKMLRRILEIENIIADFDAVRAGLQMLEDGGDFADGVIQHLGFRMAGGREAAFASFDRKAAKRLARRGVATIIPGKA